MIRASSLPQAKYCSESAYLSGEFPIGSVYTEKGTAFHAGAAALELRTQLSREQYEACLKVLTEEERSRVRAMMLRWGEYRLDNVPEHVEVEQTLAALPDGTVCSENTPGAIVGHADLLWETSGGMKVAAVLDHKSGTERDYRLQVGFYGCVYANAIDAEAGKFGCVYHAPDREPLVKWYASPSGSVLWEKKERDELWREIAYHATRERRAVTGSHCEQCFQKPRCKAFMLPAIAEPHTALAAFSHPGPVALTDKTAAQAIRVIQAMREAIKIADSQIKQYVRDNGGRLRDGEWEWVLSEQEGRRTADIEKLERDGMIEYIKRGESYEIGRWRKRR